MKDNLRTRCHITFAVMNLHLSTAADTKDHFGHFCCVQRNAAAFRGKQPGHDMTQVGNKALAPGLVSTGVATAPGQ